MPYNALTSAILGGGVGALALVAEHGVREVLQDASVVLCFQGAPTNPATKTVLYAKLDVPCLHVQALCLCCYCRVNA